MNIIDDRSKGKFTEFQNLKPGEVFEYEDRFYMKTHLYNLVAETIKYCNAVDLKNGGARQFKVDYPIKLINAEMIIHDDEIEVKE